MNTDWALQVNKMLVRVSQTKMGFTSVFNGSHKAASEMETIVHVSYLYKKQGKCQKKVHVRLNTRKAADENKVSHQ